MCPWKVLVWEVTCPTDRSWLLGWGESESLIFPLLQLEFLFWIHSLTILICACPFLSLYITLLSLCVLLHILEKNMKGCKSGGIAGSYGKTIHSDRLSSSLCPISKFSKLNLEFYSMFHEFWVLISYYWDYTTLCILILNCCSCLFIHMNPT